MAFLYLSYYVLPAAHESHRFCPCEDYGIGSNPFSLSMADLLPDDLATMILVNQRQRFIDLSGPLFRSKGRKKHGKKLDPKHLKIICRWFAWMRVITCPINSNVLQVGLGWVRVRVGIRRPWIFLQVEALPSTWPVLKVGDICVEGKGINECPPPKKRTTVVWIHHTSWHEDGHFLGIPVVETSRLFEGSLPPVLSNSRPKRQGKILENLCWPISMDPYCVWSLRASTTSPARSELNDSKVAKKLTYWMNNLIVIVSQEKANDLCSISSQVNQYYIYILEALEEGPDKT